MKYNIKSGDTLSKIAQKNKISLKLLLSVNPQIKNIDFIHIGQIIVIPNIQDVPAGAEFNFSKGVEAILSRAKSAINHGINYKLGEGGNHPEDNLPTRNKLCDCSGFVCWVLGLNRKTTIPFYAKHGGWIYTDSMEDDINSTSGIFERLTSPEPGCIVVYGNGPKIGHVGIVSEVHNGVMSKVIHCSSGNQSKLGYSIEETAPNVFNRADALWGRFVG
nr:LysM peptidoglycan-binding domain-containing protein [Flavobacterium piscis]